MRDACTAAGATDVLVTDDADEGELFVQARRMVIPAVERLGELMLEDVGVPVPLLPDLIDAVARVADRHGLLIPVIAHAGDGNTHPLVVVPRGDPDAKRRALVAFDEIMHAAIAPRRHHHRRARGGPHQEVGPARPARRGRDGPDPSGEGRPGSRRHPQPRARSSR